MPKVKVQIMVQDHVRRKLKILAEMAEQTFQNYVEGILSDMVSDIDITLNTKAVKEEEKDHVQR